MQQHSTGPKPPNWHQLAGNFGDERECLASFLAMETAEVLEGVKPANLINLADRRQPCGRNLHQLWRRHHGRTMLRQSGLEVLEQPGRNGGLLLFIYRAEPLASLLGRRSTAAFLRQAGYPNPNDLQVALAELQSRLGKEKFPHEIGVFLGYPLRDVAGFMGWGPRPFSCQGPWRIYGKPERSLELAAVFRESRCRMAQRLTGSTAAIDCLQVAARRA